MQVLLDVSQLGHVFEQERRSTARTGVFRVVERAAIALTAPPDPGVALCAFQHHDATRTFLDAHPVLRTRPFASDERTWGLGPLRRGITHAARRDGPVRHVALPLRASRRVLRRAQRFRQPTAVDSGSRLTPATLAGVDVYHSLVFALPPALAALPRLRRFLTVHDLTPIRTPEITWRGAEAWLSGVLDSARGARDYLIAVSEHTRHDLLNLRALDPARVFVVPLAADRERFHPCDDAAQLAAVRRRYGIPEGPYVLTVGSLVPHKNIPRLLRAFSALVRQERADLRLVLTGGLAWQADALTAALAEHADLRDRIVLTGFVDDADLAPLYTGAAVFVLPSLYEGFGLPLLEAMQCGTAVIASNSSAMPEVVGDAGLLVAPDDEEALAQAILDVTGDAARRADLQRRSLARASLFSWERHAAETLAAYRAVL